jgi:hypothetical protein
MFGKRRMRAHNDGKSPRILSITSATGVTPFFPAKARSCVLIEQKEIKYVAAISRLQTPQDTNTQSITQN